MSQKHDDFFGEPISVYTYAEAIEDGFLVDLTRFCVVRFLGLAVNRMTRHLFDDLKPFAEVPDGDFNEALASILRMKCSLAQGSPDNTGEVGGFATSKQRP